MIYSGIRLRDAAVGELETIGSFLKEMGISMAYAAGKPIDAQQPNIFWGLERFLAAQDIKSALFTFPGYEKSGKLPPFYRQIAIFSFAKAATDEFLRRNKAEPAVTYVLGQTALMVGVSQEPLFGTEPTTPDQYSVAMGIGEGPLIAVPGAKLENGRFSTLPDIPISVRLAPRKPLPDGVTQT